MIKRLIIPVLLIFMALLFPACSDSDLMRLAKQGKANAQYNLGVMYDKGEGVPQDYKAAFQGGVEKVVTLDKEYVQNNKKIIQQQLTKAGIRLASLLLLLEVQQVD